MEIDMHNLDRGMLKPILLNLKRIPNQESQFLMIQMMVDWTRRVSLTQSAKYAISHVLGVSKDCFPSTWVLELGAANHMTFSSNQFSSYNPCPRDKKIEVVDGTLATVSSHIKFCVICSKTFN